MPSASAQSCTLLRVERRASRINTPSFLVRIVICDFVSIHPQNTRLMLESKSPDFEWPMTNQRLESLTPLYSIIAEALGCYRLFPKPPDGMKTSPPSLKPAA